LFVVVVVVVVVVEMVMLVVVIVVLSRLIVDILVEKLHLFCSLKWWIG